MSEHNSGKLLQLGKGVAVNTDGEVLIVDKNGFCPDCCYGNCEIYFCGCGYITSIGWAFHRDFQTNIPRRLGVPDFFEFPGLCREHEWQFHADERNVSRCVEDQITTFKFNCNGDGTGTLKTEQLVYFGNNTTFGRVSQWRFKGYGGDQPRDAWPALECYPEYNAATGTLTVLVKWAGILFNDSFSIAIELSGPGGTVRPTDANAAFVSWSGPGTATSTISGIAMYLVVDECGEGVASGTATWTLANPSIQNMRATFYDGGATTLTGIIEMDYPHERLGSTDSATIDFSDTNKSTDRCGYCVGNNEVEIEFDTERHIYHVLLGSGEFAEWCGCGSIPETHHAVNTFEWTDAGMNYFYVESGDPNGKFYEGNIWPVNSVVGNQYGWFSFNNFQSRKILQEFDHVGFELERGDPFGNQGVALPINGSEIQSRMIHDGHDEPYERNSVQPFPAPNPYNTLHKLGPLAKMTMLGGNDPHYWPQYNTDVLNTFKPRFDISFDIEFMFHDWDHFLLAQLVWYVGHGNVPAGTDAAEGYKFTLANQHMYFWGTACAEIDWDFVHGGSYDLKQHGTPKIRLGFHRGQSTNRNTYENEPWIYDVQTKIPVTFSVWWVTPDESEFEAGYLFCQATIGGETYLDGEFSINGPIEPSNQENNMDFYCEGHWMATQDWSWRRRFRSWTISSRTGQPDGYIGDYDTPFLNGKTNYVISNYKEEWSLR